MYGRADVCAAGKDISSELGGPRSRRSCSITLASSKLKPSIFNFSNRDSARRWLGAASPGA